MTTKTLLAQYNKLTGKKLKTWSGTAEDLQEKINEVRATRPGRKPSPFVISLTAAGLNPRVVRAKLRKAGLKGPYKVTDPKVKKVVAQVSAS